MKFWLISDTHFNHTQKMIEYCNRPPDYEARLFKSLMEIPAEDVLIHLGDILIGRDEEMHETYIKPLRCRKWLAKGNHDHKSYSWYLTHGWDFVAEEIKLKFSGKKIVFTHIPVPIRSDFDLNIHGHFHNTNHRSQEPEIVAFYRPEQHKLVSSEHLNYKPITLERFTQFIIWPSTKSD